MVIVNVLDGLHKTKRIPCEILFAAGTPQIRAAGEGKRRMARSPNGDVRAHVSLFLSEIRAIDRLYEQYAKSAGLTPIALSILDIIYATPGGCTQKMIGEKTCLSKQNVNAVIRGLWKQGYIELQEMADRRNKEICLSESGRRYAGKVLESLHRAEALAMGELSHEQRVCLAALMNAVGCGFREGFRQVMAK